ncbi:MAG: HAD hydrolase-like protein [Calditrichia bacterium]
MKNLLFDLDGTLTDSRPGIVACFQHAFSVLGYPVPSETAIKESIGAPLQRAFQDLLPDDANDNTIDSAVALYRERFGNVGLFENRVYDGIPAALETIASSGAQRFVATSKPRVFAERILDHFNLSAYFQCIYGSELDGRFSDKSELIAHVLSDSHLLPTETVMIGDRNHDVLGALKNNVYPVGVLWGYGSREELKTAGAKKLFRKSKELAGLV